ncbi:hypothetical protein [Sphaerisporangium aureirubrum]|uniref:Tetratricopeptide repeat protein n=1 Tax=Sphaerisporangium aureirubrum TaxID=1544736 RepID=A0ABW1NM05_9ACTN
MTPRGSRRESRRRAALRKLIGRFAGADSWGESRRIVERHPELLSGTADEVLAEWIGAEDDPHTVRVLVYHRDLLRAVRRDGVDAAFAAVLTDGVPEGLRDAWRAAVEAREVVEAGGDGAARDRAFALLSALTGHPLFPEAPASGRATMTYVLGLAAMERFHVRADDATLDLSVTAFQACADATPEESPDRPDHLAALGNVLGIRYERRGAPGDLRAAVGAVAAAVRLLGPQADRRPIILHDLAVHLGMLYELDGDPDLLDEAIEASWRAVAADDTPTPHFLGNLANCLTTRYERSGALADLDNAVRTAEHGLAAALGTAERGFAPAEGTAERGLAAAEGSPEAAMARGTLGHVLQLHHARTRDRATLDRAVRLLRRAASDLPAESMYLPVCLGNLGIAHLTRFEGGAGWEALESAESAFTRALAACPPRSPQAAFLWNGLGLTLLARNPPERAAPGALDGAIRAFTEAVRNAPATGHVRPAVRANLALAHSRSYDAGGHWTDLAAGVASYRQACAEALDRQVEIALETSRLWAAWAATRASWPEAAQAYRIALEATHQIFRRQHTRTARETWLHTGKDLSAEAAHALINASAPQEAATALESGRARLLSESLTDPTRLHAHIGTLATRYEAASHRVHALEHGRFATAPSGGGA